MIKNYDFKMMEKTVRLFHPNDNDLFEIRIIKTDKYRDKITTNTYGGVFLVKDIKKAFDILNKNSTFDNATAYIVFNEISYDMYGSVATNEFVSCSGGLTKDDYIDRINWILIDADIERIAGTSSTDEEKNRALSTVKKVAAYLSEQGFEKPVFCDSGNGYHLLYRVDLEPSDSELLVRPFLNILNDMFSPTCEKTDKYGKTVKFIPRGEANIDTSVFNPARITKLYGTMTHKGKNIEERPHRRSSLESVPEEIKITPRSTIQKLLEANKPSEKKEPTDRQFGFGEFNFTDWANAYGVEIFGSKKSGNSDMYFVKCPNNSEHSTEGGISQSVVIVNPDGKISYKCLHNSCQHFMWKDFRSFYDKDYLQRQEKRTAYQKSANRPENKKSESVKKGLSISKGREIVSFARSKIFNGLSNEFVSSGFEFLDNILGGGLKSGLYVIGAATGIGKTSFVLQISDKIASKGRNVLYFALEMSEEELIYKSVSRITLWRSCKKTKNTELAKQAFELSSLKYWDSFSKNEAVCVEESFNEYNSRYGENIAIVSDFNISVQDIARTVEEYIKTNESESSPVIVVDYLQLLKDENTSKYQVRTQIDEIITKLKLISRKYDTPVLAVSSLNRESSFEPITELSLKESGGIEYTADYVIGLQYHGMDYTEKDYMSVTSRKQRIAKLLYEQKHLKDDKPRLVECKILKNRFGDLGEYVLYFYSSYSCFCTTDLFNKSDKKIAKSEFLYEETEFDKKFCAAVTICLDKDNRALVEKLCEVLNISEKRCVDYIKNHSYAYSFNERKKLVKPK